MRNPHCQRTIILNLTVFCVFVTYSKSEDISNNKMPGPLVESEETTVGLVNYTQNNLVSGRRGTSSTKFGPASSPKGVMPLTETDLGDETNSTLGQARSTNVRNGYDGWYHCLTLFNAERNQLVQCFQSQLVNNLQRIIAEVQGGLTVSEVNKTGAKAVPYSLNLQVFPDVGIRLTSSNQGNELQMGFDVGTAEDGRSRKDDKEKIKMLKRLLMMLLIPFAIQAVILPWFLASLKMMAIKSVLVGKLAILVILYNYLRNRAVKKDNDIYQENLALEHYGFDGSVEFGAWVNGISGGKRRRRRDIRGRR